MRQPIITPLLDLRWRFEYLDGSKPRWGQWTRPAIDMKEMAAFQKTNRIARAFIDCRNKRTFEVCSPVHCDGWDFVMFRWDCAASMASAIGLRGSRTLSQQTVGLVLVTRDFETIVRVDGSKPIVKKRTENDKKFQYEGFGK